ncbi:hypothetical protein FW320_00305 [Azospirillum sp. Vi22]|uniref:hypothetical protein n=1 Tax=Azospirillum baldaniorum TaxID=1064539 RepID=UPI00157BA5D7|nr:hypothetical protein [Azospirillum baldaniorum]NUB04638.1 hypothetical protein [Azospirillum baldaniorum]
MSEERKKFSKKVCYRCDNPGTTREHFPPKSFFPKGGGLQLKTVRSCENHNNKKSHDDQYVLAQICMNAARADNAAKRSFLVSIEPQLKHSERFKRLLADGAQRLPNGSYRYPVNINRINNFFDSLCCAIFFDKYGSHFNSDTHEMQHVYANFHSDDREHNEQVELVFSSFNDFFEEFRERVEKFEADKIDEVIYSNRIFASDGKNLSITIAHTFFGVFEVISLLTHKETSENLSGLISKLTEESQGRMQSPSVP